MNYWHELDLTDWREHEEPGDYYLPYRQYIRKIVGAEFLLPGWPCKLHKPFPPDSQRCSCHDSVTAGDYAARVAARPTGRGIVMAAGGRFLPGALVTVKLLRRFACALPIEIWHLGPDELPDIWRGMFDGLDVTFRDAHEYQATHPMGLSGWTLKPYSIVLSAFQEVLFLDADNHPTKDPTYLFDAPEYAETGAVFWPDRVRHDAAHPLWDIFGVPYRDEPQHETGQMLIDKARCWHALQIATHCNAFSGFHYRFSHGDTATFRFGFHALEQPFTMIPHRLLEVPIDRAVEDLDTLKDTPYMREEGDVRACFMQRDFAGDIIFQHRSGGGGAQAAFALGENKRIQHFQHEDLALEWMADARAEIEEGAGFWDAMQELYPERMSAHRREGFAALFAAMEAANSRVIVETGTIRQRDNWHNDGGFTWLLGAWTARGLRHFWTVDNDPEAIALAKELTPEHAATTQYVESDSIDFLRAWPMTDGHIDVLMLDSFDYDAGKEKLAQAHNLNEVLAALPHMAKDGIIAIDDCALAGGGKGGLSIPYLEGSGWQKFYDGYMVLLRRDGDG